MYLTLNFRKFNSNNLIEYLYLEKNTSEYLEKNTSTLTESDKNTQDEQVFDEFTKQTTLGFKQILGKVFRNGFYWKNPNIKIKIDSEEFPVESLSFFISTKEELDRMEEDDLLIVISLTHNKIKSLKDEIKSLKSKKTYFESIKDKVEEFNKVEEFSGKNANEFFNNVLSFKLSETFDEVSTQKYNIKYIDFAYEADYDISYSTICGFYYYAFILQYRLERMQVEADVSGENFNSNLIKQKTYLLNLNRFFLTANRTDHSEVKNIANQALKQFGLERRIELRSKNIQLFEDLIVRKISAIDTYRNKFLKKTMTVVTFLGMPLVLISTLMGLNKNADVVSNFASTVGDLKWVIALSFAPLIIITFLHIQRYVKSNYANSKSQ